MRLTRVRPSLPTVRANTRRSSLRRRLLVAVALVISLVAAACGDDSSSPAQGGTSGPTPVRVSFVPATTVLPLHVAEQKGIFERNGLNVTLTQAANISDIPATLGRQFDIALGTATDLIRAGGAGLDVVQVAGNTVSTEANPFVQLITRPDTGITDVAGLSGKTVGSPTLGGVIHAGVLYWAKQKGVQPAEIKGVQVPSPNLPDQLKAQRVDAVEALEPFATQLKKDGNVSLGDPFSPIADPLATNFWISQGSWANSNKDTVKRFVDSLKQAEDFIDQNPAEARQVLRQYTGLPAPVASAVPLPTYNFDIRKDDLDSWVKVLKDIGQFDRDVDTNKLVLSPI